MTSDLASTGALAAICLVLALCLYRWPVGRWAPKAIPWLMLGAGLGITGLFASIIAGFTEALFSVAGGVTGTVFGVGLPIVVLVPMVIKFWADVKGGSGSSKSGMINAFLLFPIISVPFAAVTAWAISALGTAGASLAEILAQL